jgi:two-component system phosphate regulon sensor histidine kinase PhoR
MDKSSYAFHRVKVIALLSLAFVFLFVAYLFSGAWFVMKYVNPDTSYTVSVYQVLSSSAFWFFFIIQLVIYTTVVLVILNTFYNERRMTLMQQDFVNNVTHEIKTPLSTILMAAEVLVEENIQNKPFRREQYISIIRNEGERLREELDRVLDVSRISKVGVHLNKEVFDPEENVLAILDRMRLQFKNYHGTSTIKWEASGAQIHFDKKSFDLILTNLIDNALKYNISEPEIIISGKLIEGNLMLRIQDNGIGIGEQYIGELFHRFFRVPIGETHHIKGFGLGLYLVKQLMDAHNSAIFVTSIENQGTTVTLKIPLAKENNE